MQAAGRIIQDLLALSLGKEPKKEDADLCALIAEARVRAKLPESIRCRVVLNPSPFHVLVDSVQFRQVFMHLLQNASQAIEHHGEFFITGQRSDLADTVIIRDSGLGVLSSRVPSNLTDSLLKN